MMMMMMMSKGGGSDNYHTLDSTAVSLYITASHNTNSTNREATTKNCSLMCPRQDKE